MFAYTTVLILVTASSVLSQEITQKICSMTPSSSECQQLARGLEVACSNNFHSVDCLLNIENNTSHLGRITGEEAILGSNLLSKNVVVLAEIRNAYTPPETVVIVKNSVPDNFINLKGKKLCHPGYAHDTSFSHYLLQELENKILEIEQPDCNDNVTLLERRLKTISSFFGDSCRPGPWTQKEKADQILKEKYSSLCNLCGSSKCSVLYEAPFNDSLKCLLEYDADVALTTLYEANIFFNSSTNSQNYKYLCKNGTSTSSSVPCIWSTKLPDLLVAETKSANFMEEYLRKNLQSYINSTKISDVQSNAGEALILILKLTKDEKIVFLEQYSNNRSLNEYVGDRVVVPQPADRKECDRVLKWCTYSDAEQNKCRWLSQAAVNWGIQPVVECVRSEGNDELSCLDDIKKQRADIVVASSDYAYISLNKGLSSIAFPETDTRNLSVILAVRRDGDDSIKSFEDMKNKKACVPRFGGKEHLALVDTTKNLGITDDVSCDYGKVLSDFVGYSCAPGVRSSLISESTEYVDKDKLCQQCQPINATPTANYCNDDEVNKYFGNKGAIDCLRDEKGDFAIITNGDMGIDTDLRVICKNNTLSSTRGLNVDKACALATLPQSEVIAANDNPKNSDIRFALYEFERWFGENLKKSFYLFDVFNGQPDLLFLDSTPGLNIDNEIESIQEYKKLLRNVKKCNINSSSANGISTFSFIIPIAVSINGLLRM